MLAFLLEASKVGQGWQDYAAAYEEMQRTGRPMVVLVTAQWCPPCQLLKHNVLPDPRITHVLKGFACALVDVDAEPKLAQKLGGGQGVPFIAVYAPDEDGYQRRTIRGYQSVEALTRFLLGSGIRQ
jgi:thiol:disulfide interchange protein